MKALVFMDSSVAGRMANAWDQDLTGSAHPVLIAFLIIIVIWGDANKQRNSDPCAFIEMSVVALPLAGSVTQILFLGCAKNI